MNTAIYYDEPPMHGEDERNFADIIQPMLASWLPAFRSIKSGYSQEVLPILGHVTLMAWLPAKGNIPVDQTIIEGFREIFKIVRHDILENPTQSALLPEDRAKFEQFNMRLAKAITVLDIANDKDIVESFKSAEK